MSTRSDTALAPFRDVSGRQRDVWARRVVLALLALFVLAALVNRFGQHPSTSRAGAGAASLEVQSPENLRGGLIFQSRFTITAHRALRKPELVLGSGWLESMSVNSIEPQPASEESRDGRTVLTLPSLAAGDSAVLRIYFQVNPTNVARRSQDVELRDGDRRVLAIHRDVTVWP
jgi:hypothetical protein